MNKTNEISPHTLIRLKVPESKKTKEWFKDIFEYHVPHGNTFYPDDRAEMKRLYELLNNDLSGFQQELKSYVNPLAEFGEIEDELIPYNKLRNKVEILNGEMLARSNDYKVVLLTAKAIRIKNEKMLAKIQESVNSKLAESLQKFQEQMSSMSPEEQDELIKELTEKLTPPDINYKNFQSEHEIVNSKFLKYTYYDQDIKSKRLETQKDTTVADRAFVYNGWKYGKPYFKVCNVLNCIYLKSPNEPWVQKGDYFAYQDEITIGEALDEYINVLNKEDTNKLLSYSNYFNKRGNGETDGYMFDHTKFYANVEATMDKLFATRGTGTHQSESNGSFNNSDTVLRTHLEFKAYKEVMFYTYKDEYGEPITVQLNKNTGIIPPDAEKVKYTNEYFEQDTKWVWADEVGNTHEVKVLYIPRRYECVRLGEDLFLYMREVPFQPDNTNSPFSKFELSYKGGIINSRNSKFFSLLQNALSYQFQIFALKHLQNREIAKYEGNIVVQDVDQIPDELGQDAEGNPVEGLDKLTQSHIIRRKTGSAYYSGSRTSTGLPNNQRGRALEVAQLGSAGELLNLEELIRQIDMEMGISMGIPPQRESQVLPGTNVTDNQQAIAQGTLSTQTYSFWNNKLWAHVLNEHLHNLRTEARLHFKRFPNSNHTFEYVLPDNTKELLEVTPSDLSHNDIGIYLHESPQEAKYLEFMTQKILQNTVDPNTMDAMSSVLKAITSGASTEEVNKMIQMEADKIRKENEKRMQQEQQNLMELKQMEREDVKFESNLKIEEAIAIEIQRRKTQLEKAKIDAQVFALSKDIDKDNINDDITVEETKAKADADENSKQRKFDAQENEKDRKLEKELAGIKNKNTSSDKKK